jgi:hypothetical protein
MTWKPMRHSGFVSIGEHSMSAFPAHLALLAGVGCCSMPESDARDIRVWCSIASISDTAHRVPAYGRTGMMRLEICRTAAGVQGTGSMPEH